MKTTLTSLLALALVACVPDPPESPSLDSLARAAVEEVDTGVRVEPIQLGEPVLEEPEDLAVSEPVPVEEPPVSEPVEELASFSLRRGETLAHYARWSGLSVEEVASLSGLDLDGSYPVGAEIRVPASLALQVEVERASHHEARVDRYLASRGGSLGQETITVRTGDTAWSIAQIQHGVPVWILESFNPDVSLDRLRPGQTLQIPVIADVVVDAEDLPPIE